MRPIDADRLLKAFCGHCEDYENCKTTCFDFRIIQTQPTVDAVPVVRCKDCKYWERKKQTNADKYFRNATDEEIVEAWYFVYHNVIFNSTNSRLGLLQWLKQEVQNDQC